jgi:hypothetical protein
MEFDVSRLRRGELIAGGGAVVLLVDLFTLKWYGFKSPYGPTASTLVGSTSSDGWHGLEHGHWLLVVTILIAFALVLFQATRRAPAVPIGIGVILIVVALLDALALIYRVLINQPGPNSLVTEKAGACVGLAAAIAILVGAYLSLREEGLPARDARTGVETVPLDPSPPAPQS